MSILQFINDNSTGICVVLSLLAMLFILFGHAYRDQVQSALKKDFVKLPATSFDWWSVTHAGLFGLFGYIVPNRHLSFFTLGLCFELIEDALSADATTQLADCMSPSKSSNIMCALSVNDGYWYAKWDDVFVNLLGYTIGSSLRTSC